MIQILVDYPLLLLFVVASLGYLIGSINIRGYSLGVAAILFTGLAFGAIDPRLQIPEIMFLLGLSMFVYSIGLSSGPAFFQSYKKNGVRDFGFTISMLVFTGFVACGLWLLFGFSAATITGIYAGSTTNTAALAGVIGYIDNAIGGTEGATLVKETVVGYSFSYPMGILGGMIGIVLMEKLLKIDYAKEKQQLKKDYPISQGLTSVTIEVTNQAIFGIPLRKLFNTYDWNVTFGRVFKDDNFSLANWDTQLQKGNLLMVVGSVEDLEEVTEVLGVKSNSTIGYDRTLFDSRRIFVSNPEMVGKSIASLNLSQTYDATITRIRRGDIEMLAKSDTVLELGDRIRFIASREDLEELAKLFGDSYHESSRVNLFSFGLGIGLGLILGSIEFSFGPDFSFKLGYAGGPLIVGLILGALRRTGPVVWALPYSANVTLQQIGLIFLLSAIGVRSGHAFVESMTLEGLCIFSASAVISLLTAITILWVGYKWVKMPFSFLMGVVSNQPAILDFANTRSKSNIPTFGFALMFPIALISKILIAQILFLFLK